VVTSNPVITSTGRRKCAIASVRMTAGEGKMFINGRDVKEYFPTVPLQSYIQQPLMLTNTSARFNIHARLEGGGPTGQAGALRHGIARALVKADATLRGVLKGSGFLTRDSRIRERKKPGQPGARKRFQFSKR